jgi:hypothetical protein
MTDDKDDTVKRLEGLNEELIDFKEKAKAPKKGLQGNRKHTL